MLAGMGIGGVGARGGGGGGERYVLITFLSCGLSIHWLTFQFSTVQYIYVATLKSMAA